MPAKADPLLVAIERLTTRHKESERLPGGVGTHYADHEALLKQLRDAIGGDVGRGGGASQSASSRTPIDPDALTKYLEFVEHVQDFHFTWTNVRPPADEKPELTLSNAYRAFRDAIARERVPGSEVERITSMWENACDRILAKLSPPTSRELIGFPCPNCGVARAREVINRDRTTKDRAKAWYDTELHVALTVTYVPDPVGGGLGKSAVHCRACTKRWEGDHQIRFVANELERIENHAMAMWAEHEHLVVPEVQLRQWAALPVATSVDPLGNREAWMLLAFKELNPPDDDDPEGITPDGETVDHILAPTGAQ